MGERTGYAPGIVCWADLSTTDQEAKVAVVNDPQGAVFALYAGGYQA